MVYLPVQSQAEAPQRPDAEAKQTNKIVLECETVYETFPGTKLIGANSTLKPIVDGAFLLATRVSPDAVWLKDEDVGGDVFEVSVSSLVKHTRLRRALTLCSAQGRALSGTVALYDVNSKHFTSTHLYVGLSRATDGRKVSIASS